MKIGSPGARLLLILAACLSCAGCKLGGADGEREEAKQALRLHPDNPRYLVFRGKPTVLITSGEPYGAVINADFDYVRYLDELARQGFNLTRVFTGSHLEPQSLVPGERDSEFAPSPGRLVSPWAEPHERRPDGGRKFDLTRWNPAYFERLKRFVEEAGRRGIVVELVLFSGLYDLPRWRASPFHSQNNVNGVGEIAVSRLYTLDNGGVLEHQDALVRKLVTELRSYDNVYYEVINEGWEDPAPASDEWQDHIIETIESAESGLVQRHLIARNYRHGGRPIRNPHPSVSIFNFHYQRDVSKYGNLAGVLAFDETGFQGTGDRPYRQDAWFFMLSGGGIYSNLDWSFTPGREDGSYDFPPGTPGGGGRSLRRSLAVLKRFLERFELPQMRPAHEVVMGAPADAETRVLQDIGKSYAIYVSGGRDGELVLDLDLPPGRYRARWIDTRDGTVKERTTLDHDGEVATLSLAGYEGEVALAIEAE